MKKKRHVPNEDERWEASWVRSLGDGGTEKWVH